MRSLDLSFNLSFKLEIEAKNDKATLILSQRYKLLLKQEPLNQIINTFLYKIWINQEIRLELDYLFNLEARFGNPKPRDKNTIKLPLTYDRRSRSKIWKPCSKISHSTIELHQCLILETLF